MFNFGPGLTAFGDIMQGFGSMMQGEEMQGAYEYNAAILDQEAQIVMNALPLAIEDIEGAKGDLLSTQKEMYAKAGVTMSGSPTDVALDTATQFDFDKIVTTYNAKVKAQRLHSEAAMQRYYGEISEQKGMFGLGGGLLRGGLSLMGL